MLNILRRGAAGFETQDACAAWTPPEDAIWIDLVCPTRDEECAVETALGLDLPTLAEMAALEPSSRLYQEKGATFMTATLLAHSTDTPTATPVTFVLAAGRLITIRYEELRAFTVFAARASSEDVATGTAALLGLLDAVVERLSALLEKGGEQVEASSNAIFRRPKGGAFEPILTDLARVQSLGSMIRNSLVSLARVLSYAALAQEISRDSECRAHLRSLHSDVQSLSEHAAAQSTHISFLLDAALGLINIQQNSIIKFFSVVAVVFMPPTLIASIYGMNFQHMPELAWPLGYPLALLAMLAAAVAPVIWFRRKGWF